MIPLRDRWKRLRVKAKAMGTEKASQVIQADNRLYHHPGEENLASLNITAAIKTVNRELKPKS